MGIQEVDKHMGILHGDQPGHHDEEQTRVLQAVSRAWGAILATTFFMTDVPYDVPYAWTASHIFVSKNRVNPQHGNAIQ